MQRSVTDPTGLTPRLALPVHASTRIALVRPHYPENVGAAARAMKTMGFSDFALVRPSRLAVPEHEMAQKMAVKSWDVLDGAQRCENLEEARAGYDRVIATTSRRGVRVWTARQASEQVLDWCTEGLRTVILFGNEKSGLTADDIEHCDAALRIPMVADQPSINLAQAVQLVTYELYVAALLARES